jgi:hypothetical protein
MTDDIKLWLPPMLTLLGTLIVITFTAWLNTRSVHAMIAELRQTVRADNAELRGEIAELRGEVRADIVELRTEVAVKLGDLRTDLTQSRGELKLDIVRLENKLDHYAETQASHSEEIGRLKGRG